MKKYPVLTVTLATLLALAALFGLSAVTAGPAAAVGNLPQNGVMPLTAAIAGSQPVGISVSGTGTVTVTPDIAILSMGVYSKEPTVSAAQSIAAEAMNKVLAALRQNGLAEKDIKTTGYSIQPVTRYDNIRYESVPDGYSVSNTVSAKIRTFDKVGAIIDAVAAAGGDATRIYGVTVTVEKPEGYYGEARGKAMADARSKAEQLASLAGVKLGSAVYITESTGYYYPTPSFAAKDAGGISAPNSTPISAGETEITLSVQVTYTIAS